MIRRFRYSRHLTLDIVAEEVGQRFGHAAQVRSPDGMVLHQTEPRPFGNESAAIRDACEWVEAQPSILGHRAADRRFVGRVGSGKGYYVHVSDGEPIRARTAWHDNHGQWQAGPYIPVQQVPELALRKVVR